MEDELPTYQYACTECGHGFEQVQSFSDDALTVCPQCQGRLRKVFNAVGVVFKGSGFYRTDSRTATGAGDSGGSDGSRDSGGSSEKKPAEPKAGSGASSDSSSSSSPSKTSSSESSSSSKSKSKPKDSTSAA